MSATASDIRKRYRARAEEFPEVRKPALVRLVADEMEIDMATVWKAILQETVP